MLENNNKISCKVTIFGDSYSVVTDESQEHVIQAAAMVDSAMKEIMARSGSLDVGRCAILAALRIASKVVLLEAEQVKNSLHSNQLIELINRELPEK